MTSPCRILSLLTPAICAAMIAAAPPGATPSMQSPVRVALGPDSSLFVSDYGRRKVFTIDRDSLVIVDEFTVAGRPTGIAFDGEYVLVGNETTGRVEIFCPDGVYVGAFATVFQQPNDIAVSTRLGLVFVASTQAGTVDVFTLDGMPVRTIPASGQEPLAYPTSVALYELPLAGDANGDDVVNVLDFLAVLAAWHQIGGPEDVDGDGVVDIGDFLMVLANWGALPAPSEVLVADFGDVTQSIDAAVRIYDDLGVHLQTISGQFSRPQGLVGIDNGLVFVVDSLLGQVLVIDRATDQTVRTLGEFGTEPGQLILPLDVVIEPDSSDVFVTNNQSARIEVFPQGGLPP